jgi:hypothetical protein
MASYLMQKDHRETIPSHFILKIVNRVITLVVARPVGGKETSGTILIAAQDMSLTRREYIYIYIHVCVCVCVCVRARARADTSRGA